MRLTARRPLAVSGRVRGDPTTIEGDIDLLGVLGLDDTARHGFSEIRVTFHVGGAAEAEQLERLVEQARVRSAGYDVLTHGTAITISAVTT
jgi:hypothetical protein